jgi:transposase
MQIQAHHPDDLEQLRQRSRQQRDAKQRDRYRAVVLALEGHTAPEIAQTLARSRRFVQLWAYTYRDHGPDAIGPKRQSGCPSKLPVAQQQSFKDRLLAGPTEADGVCTLRAKDIRRILQEEFGVEYSLAGVYDLLHRLGFSCLAPRPRHRKNDPAAMQQWVEQAPLLSRPQPSNIPASPSRSGSRTKPGSASKEP